MQDEEEQTEEEQVVSMPADATPPEPEVEPEPVSDIDDMFEVPQPEDNDMRTEHLVNAPEEDDMADLIEAPEEEDISDLLAGEPPAPEPERVQRPPVRRVRLVRRRPSPPPTGLQGVGY